MHRPGATVITEGDRLREMYVVKSGAAEVFVADRHGVEQRVGGVSAGSTLGEMSLLTGQPASGTVRAAEPLELYVVREADFNRLTERFPSVYRNVGAILSRRLALTNRLAAGAAPARVTALRAGGSPPLLPVALAASVAWHTRASTLLLVHGRGAAEIEALRAPSPQAGSGETHACAVVAAVDGLPTDFDELAATYANILVLTDDADRRVDGLRTLDLVGGHSAPVGNASYTVRAWASPGERVGPSSDGVVNVPELVPADQAALRDGVLPPTTAAGKAIGWVARDLAHLKVGVALGAGSVRGFAHFGVLRELERAGVFPDCIAGTSVGAAAGGLYAFGLDPDEAAELFVSCGPALFRPRISTKSFLSSRGLRNFIRGVGGDVLIEDLNTPFAAVAADIETQREVVFRRGLLWQAVVASISIPGIYPANRIGRYTVVDGGIVNPVPCSTAGDLGADVVIGVRLGAKLAQPDSDAAATAARGRPPSAVTSILRSIEMMQSRLAPEATDPATLMIRPELPEIPSGRLRSFDAGLRYVDDGAAATREALPRLAGALPWVRASL